MSTISRAGGELHVEHAHRGAKPLQIVVLDVATILAEVRGDPVGAGRFAQPRGLDRVGLVGAASLPDGGHVVHVDVEPHRCRHCPGFGRGLTSHANICQMRDL